MRQGHEARKSWKAHSGCRPALAPGGSHGPGSEAVGGQPAVAAHQCRVRPAAQGRGRSLEWLAPLLLLLLLLLLL